MTNRYNAAALDLWILSPPSRRLRKAYAQLAILDAAIDAARRSNPCPEHAPTAYQIIRQRLRPLQEQRWRLLARIERLDGCDAP